MLLNALRNRLPVWAGGIPKALLLKEELLFTQGTLSVLRKVVHSDHVNLQFGFDTQKVLGCAPGEKIRMETPSASGQRVFAPICGLDECGIFDILVPRGPNPPKQGQNVFTLEELQVGDKTELAGVEGGWRYMGRGRFELADGEVLEGVRSAVIFVEGLEVGTLFRLLDASLFLPDETTHFSVFYFETKEEHQCLLEPIAIWADQDLIGLQTFSELLGSPLFRKFAKNELEGFVRPEERQVALVGGSAAFHERINRLLEGLALRTLAL